MTTKHRWSSLLTGVSCVFLFAACSDDAGTSGSSSDTEDMTETSASGDGDGDDTDSSEVGTDTDSGDGDGDATDTDPATDTDSGDGDGDDTTDSGDGDGDDTTDSGDGDGDDTTDSGDGDGDTTDSGDGDGDEPMPFCGDGVIDDNEVCDDGVNDGAYGGCEADCSALGPFCGDGELNGPETCDDGNDDNTDGCIGSCEVPHSCLTIHDYDDASPDGGYMISPEGNEGEPFMVHCDMSTDGGGYTFLKILPQNQQSYAVNAEADCATRGMQLWIPRTQEHVLSGWAIANDANIGPDAGPTYMRLLGIYPDQNGATCNLQPMNSDNQNCNWSASDGEAWWVHERNNINEPNGDNSTEGSMFYSWFMDGSLNHHNDIPGLGYNTNRYMCDVGDKF